MENETSKQQLIIPTLPTNFENLVGTSKRDFAEALLDILRSAHVSGPMDDAAPFDLGNITSRVEALEDDVEKIKGRTPRRIILTGLTNGSHVVTFAELPTANYEVAVAFRVPNGNIANLNWGIVNGSKQTAQFTLRINGDNAPYDVEVTVTPMTGI